MNFEPANMDAEAAEFLHNKNMFFWNWYSQKNVDLAKKYKKTGNVTGKSSNLPLAFLEIWLRLGLMERNYGKIT